MRSVPLRVVAALTAATLIAACGGGSDDEGGGSEEPASSVEQAQGEQASTEDFSFTAPEGWSEITDDIPGFSPEVAFSSDEGEEFNDNVNVVREPNAFDGDSEEYADANIQALEEAGYGNPTKEGTFGDFVVVTAEAEQGGTTYVVNQYYAVLDDQGWVVTFSFAEDTPEAERTEVSESVMQTWEWA